MTAKTDKTRTNMTDETRAEIVRLARKGWSVDQIATEVKTNPAIAWGAKDWEETKEQVQQVIDESVNPSQPGLSSWLQATIPDSSPTTHDGVTWKTDDPIGRIAKWLDEAREAGYSSREQAEMLVGGTNATVRQAIEWLTCGSPERLADDAYQRTLADQLDAMAEETGDDNAK